MAHRVSESLFLLWKQLLPRIAQIFITLEQQIINHFPVPATWKKPQSSRRHNLRETQKLLIFLIEREWNPFNL